MPLDLTLTSPSNGPDAIGRHEGRAIFVPFAIPGETARVEIVEEKPTFARARLLEVLSPSPDRVAPACKHFGTCGGCHFQHMRYEAQLKWKRQIVIDQLARIGGLESPNVLDTISSLDPFHYRNHIQFSQTSDGKLGFISVQPAREASVVPISECHIARPEIMELFGEIDIEKLDVDRIGVRVGAQGETMLVFESETGEPPDVELDLPISVATVNKDGEAFAMIGGDTLIHEVLGRPFRVSPGSFFQVNTAQAETLVKLVLEALNLQGGETVLDLYSGVGLFSAFIAPKVNRLIGVESFPPAVRDAEANLDEFDNVELYESPVELALDHLVTLSAGACHRVLLDPPRAGCDKQVIQHLLTLAAPRLVYVSCDPATLARDAKRLIAGGYRLTSAQPLDMFPQTHHIETVAIFER
ncbi:MAG: class I SAM-dependent RNA methyltransferase [Chloroflexota bacterium]